MLSGETKMPELPIWLIAIACVFLAGIVAVFNGREAISDGVVTMLATFVGVLAGLAVNPAHDRNVREEKANNIIKAMMVGIHENLRPYAKLLSDSRVLGISNFNNEEEKKSIEQQFSSMIQQAPVTTPSVMSNLTSNSEIVEFIDEITLYTIVDYNVKMNFSSNQVNNYKSDAPSGYTALQAFAGFAAHAYEKLCMQLRKNEGQLENQIITRFDNGTPTDEDLIKTNCKPQWSEADVVNTIFEKARGKK
jgi:hypothetical protein